MAENCARIFTLAEANTVIPNLIDLTTEAIRQLDVIRGRHGIVSPVRDVTVPAPVLAEVETVLDRWSQRVNELGGNAKGYFTVDFQSADPEMLYCWTYGEDTISFAHKVWENFSHRRPLTMSAERASDHMKWVH